MLTLMLGIFAISTVSAFWPFDGATITGNVPKTMNTINSVNAAISSANGNRWCVDSDNASNGIEAKVNLGVVIYGKGSKVRGYSRDRCTLGKGKVIEKYCQDGKAKSQSLTCPEGCEYVKVSFNYNDKTLTKNVARCIGDETPIDENCTTSTGNPDIVFAGGKSYEDGCKGNILVDYSCSADGKLETLETECVGDCKNGVCVGDCYDSDPQNEGWRPGIVELRNATGDIVNPSTDFKKDLCDPNKPTKVWQYKCSADKKSIKLIEPMHQCGSGKVCKIDSEGIGICVWKTEPKPLTIEQRITILEKNIVEIKAILNNLTTN